MEEPSIFTQLCDLVDDLNRAISDLPHSHERLVLEVLVERFDALIDQTVGLELVEPKDDTEADAV